ncbi:hypothetical protein DESUT3_39000 [Desulfuromonas versatilis]|uniref:Peptidase MA-like domain-containing protein n=1 Tax=Desulfuromonas versatilis TaxID=2802975 RepID=A0ABM8HXY3_9BACT|nr:hypothetical protein [Desulfuromonas versatilis]BCR06831.1 hypothetical protein DESUT3_39000 [Desulfuromonas versatilis]
MKQFVLITAALLALGSPVLAAAEIPPLGVSFSQQVVSLDPSGRPYPAVNISPEQMEGIERHDFDLGRGRRLQVVTNLDNPQGRGLDEIARIVRRSYDYLETATGRSLDKGVLIYLIELDSIPLSYTFEASYPADSHWSEVRLALLRRGEQLLGPYGSADLAELIYDTIPHELGHDVLAGIPNLAHDIDGRPSYHTRWFIEGVCEILAKGFARRENSSSLQRFLATRKVGTVLGDPRVRSQLFSWSQENGYEMGLESDLYGASMLMVMAWAEQLGLPALLDRLSQCSDQLCGADLVSLMVATTGMGEEQLFERGYQLGRILREGTYLADRRLQKVGWGG